MNNCCIHLKEILTLQQLIVLRHIEERMLKLHILDREEAIGVFIEQFGEVMRAVFCGFCCPIREDCQIAQEKYLPKALSQDQDIFLTDELDLARQLILREHIEKHEWFRHIQNNLQAQADFMAEADKIIKEIICGYYCPRRMECPRARKLFFPPKH
jgi:hypothetical protein